MSLHEKGMKKLAKRGSQAMLGLYIAAVLAAESSSGCPLPCGAVCLELIDHKDCRGSACSQQELEFGDLCTGDATCGDAGRCYVAAAETEAKVLAATTRRRARRADATREASLRRRALSDDGEPHGRADSSADVLDAADAEPLPAARPALPLRRLRRVRGPRARPGRRGGRARVPAGARAPAAARPRRHVLRGVPRRGGLLLLVQGVAEPGQGAARARRRRATHARARLPARRAAAPARTTRTRSSTSAQTLRPEEDVNSTASAAAGPPPAATGGPTPTAGGRAGSPRRPAAARTQASAARRPRAGSGDGRPGSSAGAPATAAPRARR